MNEDEKNTKPGAADPPAEPAAQETPADPKPEPAPEPKSADAEQPSPQDAPESPQAAADAALADEVASLRAQLARATGERTAAIEAVKLGVDAKQIPYVLRLMEMPDSGKEEDIAAAVKKVLDDVPAFRSAASGNQTGIRIGAKASQEAQNEDVLARAFGNKVKN